jgi:membrane associated rhomboid family serine protease
LNKQAIKDFQFILFLVAFMWILEIINMVMNHSLNNFSIYPRELEKLYGIFTMHFLHWNLTHIISNSLPLLFLGFLVSNLGKTKQVTLVIMLLSGLLVWLFARNGTHAGASALVMGYWGYLISCAIFERSLRSILIAIITIAIYGGIVLSLIDFRASISFEGHLFGFVSGIVSAWIWHKKTRKTYNNKITG